MHGAHRLFSGTGNLRLRWKPLWQTADVRGIPERFSGMGVSPAFLVFSACPVLPPAGVLSGVSSGGEVFSLVGEQQQNCPSPEWVEGHNHCGSRGKR